MSRKLKKVGYELCDVNIIQAEVSDINHRSECDTMIEMCGRKVHPVVVAPMAAVTNADNYKVWLDNDFICVVPRTVPFEKRLEICTETFCSFSLDEAELLLKTEYLKMFENKTFYVCVDIAQGTMRRMYNVCKKLKWVHYGVVTMAGNVATPLAYRYYADAKIDYMRLQIGSGSRCTTACNVGIHYPTATLIDDIMEAKQRYINSYFDSRHPKPEEPLFDTKIIVDGGIANFDDIQKCLALGAFAVMNGSSFAKAEEACGEVRYLTMTDSFETGMRAVEYNEAKANREAGSYELTSRELHYLTKSKPFREYYGMSTKRAQKECGNVCSKTSEGVVRPVPVEYPIAKWADNMKSFLASAMSYTDSKNIDELRENTELIINLSGDKSYRK
jgi:IMP dehydrogenase/GMP reductase